MQFRGKTQFLTPFLLSELPKNAYKLTSPLCQKDNLPHLLLLALQTPRKPLGCTIKSCGTQLAASSLCRK